MDQVVNQTYAVAAAPSAVNVEVETWQNVTEGRGVILKFSHQGQIIDSLIDGGKRFVVTPQERRLNQELAANESLDMFTNGMFQPVSIPETVEDKAIIDSNPNNLGPEGLTTLFSAHWKTFEKRVSEITNPATIQSLIDISNSDEVSASVKQQQFLRERLVACGGGEILHVKPGVTSTSVLNDQLTPIAPR